jgi:hypothetical protein
LVIYIPPKSSTLGRKGAGLSSGRLLELGFQDLLDATKLRANQLRVEAAGV